MKLSKEMAKIKLLKIEKTYSLTENEKQAIQKGVKALSRSQKVSDVIKEIESLPVQINEEGDRTIAYEDVMYLLSKCKEKGN